MRSVAYIVLRFIHALYALAFLAYSCWKRLTAVAPLSLNAPRRQIPKHLAILFVPDPETHYDLTEKCLLESVYRVLDWCREVGILSVTVYDEYGIIRTLSHQIERHLVSRLPHTFDLGMDYPPTPPLSNCASRSDSPEHDESPFTVIHYASSHCSTITGKRVTQWNAASLVHTTVYLVSYEASKPAIAAAASNIAREESSCCDDSFSVSVDEMKWRLEGKNGLPPSDFMIVHPLSPAKYNRQALQLHGFPPFQTRLTEIYHNRLLKRHDAWINWILPSRFYRRRLPVPLTELLFREALDVFAGAEMRFGK